MEDVEVSGDVVRIRFKEHENPLGMTDGFVLPLENIDSVSTAKVSCKYPRRGSFGTRDGMVFYYMRDGDKVVTLNLRGHRYSYCRNNPHKYVDPNGELSVQLGYGGSTGLLVGGYSVSQGLVLQADWSGFEIGWYTEIGVRPYFGAGASIGPQITITPSAQSIDDVKGKSFSTSIGLGLIGAKGGVGVSHPIDSNGNLDYNRRSYCFDLPIPGLSFGVEAGLHAHVVHGDVIEIWKVDFNKLTESEEQIKYDLETRHMW